MPSSLITVRLHYPEAITPRELDAAERELTENLSAAAKITSLPRGAWISIGYEPVCGDVPVVEPIDLETVPRG